MIVISFLTGKPSLMPKLHIGTGSLAVSNVAYEFHMYLLTWILIMCIYYLSNFHHLLELYQVCN